MLINPGDLIPVKNDAIHIPWTKRKTQILNFLHRGPVSFQTYVYDTNVGDISPLSTYFNPQRWTDSDLNNKFGQIPDESEEQIALRMAGNSNLESTKEEEEDATISTLPRLLLYPLKNKTTESNKSNNNNNNNSESKSSSSPSSESKPFDETFYNNGARKSEDSGSEDNVFVFNEAYIPQELVQEAEEERIKQQTSSTSCCSSSQEENNNNNTSNTLEAATVEKSFNVQLWELGPTATPPPRRHDSNETNENDKFWSVNTWSNLIDGGGATPKKNSVIINPPNAAAATATTATSAINQDINKKNNLLMKPSDFWKVGANFLPLSDSGSDKSEEEDLISPLLTSPFFAELTSPIPPEFQLNTSSSSPELPNNISGVRKDSISPTFGSPTKFSFPPVLTGKKDGGIPNNRDLISPFQNNTLWSWNPTITRSSSTSSDSVSCHWNNNNNKDIFLGLKNLGSNFIPRTRMGSSGWSSGTNSVASSTESLVFGTQPKITVPPSQSNSGVNNDQEYFYLNNTSRNETLV